MFNPALRSWVEVRPDSDFSIHNLPFGVYSTSDQEDQRMGVAIGDYILDLQFCVDMDYFFDIEFDKSTLYAPILNFFMSEGREVCSKVRQRIQELLAEGSPEADHIRQDGLVKQSDVTMHLPLHIGDYTDFYSSEDHAANVGRMFRDPSNPLLPNWKHLPVAYHGRANSICVSGTSFHRPKGQIRPDDNAPPVFTPTRALDFELEMAFIIGRETELGQSIDTASAEAHIFGMVIFNDWSARDVQRWEYVPLGPFLAKNFFSSVSPWVVTLDAMEPFRVAGPVQDPEVLPYLQYEGRRHFDIQLEVAIRPQGSDVETVVSRSNYKHLYWNLCQQLAHHTVNGCPVSVGDMMASGTISGPDPDSLGSMLELTLGGKQPVTLADGAERKYLLDGDTVIMRAWGERDGVRVGFGSVENTILPTL